MQSDWQGAEKWNNIEKELVTIGVKVIYLPHIDGISTTELREGLRK